MLRESSVDELFDNDDDDIDEKSSTKANLSDSSDELKELCFLLDEERLKMHQLAEQWKQFGTSTIQRLESQIVGYQEKLNELEQRQSILVQENAKLKAIVDHTMMTNTDTKHHVGTQTAHLLLTVDKHNSCFHRPKPAYDRLSRTNVKVPINKLQREISIEDPLQQQISLQNMFDAIKAAEVYDSIDDIPGDDDGSEKSVLKDFCNLIWKYLEERSKPKSSCLL